MKTAVWIVRFVCFLSFALATDIARADVPLRPDDQIQMKLGGVPSNEISAVSGVYTIDGEGTVNLPHIGRLKIGGLSPGAAESAIEAAYKAREIYTNPNVVITMLAQTRFVNVGGEVKSPQRISFTPDLTIFSAINAAGGFSAFADARKVRLLRDNKLMIIDVNKIRTNPSLDVPVQPGDRIEAPSILQNSKNSQGNLQQAEQNSAVASAQKTEVEEQVVNDESLNGDPGT